MLREYVRADSSPSAACLGLCVAEVILVLVAIILVFGSALLNSYEKGKTERAFAQVRPRAVLQIIELGDAIGPNRLIAQSASHFAKCVAKALYDCNLQGKVTLRPATEFF